jgi:hypothetical protein
MTRPCLEVADVFQQTRAGRTKPWGTGHAVLAAQPAVERPVAGINADEFYGAAGDRTLAAHFALSQDYPLVWYPLKQPL